MATVLITGGTGLIGQTVSKLLLAKGYKIIIITRDKNRKTNLSNLEYATWNVNEQGIDKWAIEQADFIIHLAGASVAEKRWTKKRKKRNFRKPA